MRLLSDDEMFLLKDGTAPISVNVDVDDAELFALSLELARIGLLSHHTTTIADYDRRGEWTRHRFHTTARGIEEMRLQTIARYG